MIKLKRHMVADNLINDIIDQIQQGALRPGDPILSLNQLVRRYSISKSSVTKAVNWLIAEGVIESIQGKGNYVASSPMLQLESQQSETRKDSSDVIQLGLSLPATAVTNPSLTKIKEYAIEKGVLLTVFDVTENFQNPNHERLFIENLVKAGASGIAVFASPLEPVNEQLFKQLRQQGIKVAIISPYKYDLTDEVIFGIDCHLIGYNAVKYLKDRGCESIYFVNIKTSPVYTSQIEEGVFSASRKMNLKATFDHIRVNGSEKGENATSQDLLARNSHLKKILAELPAHSGIICRSRIDAMMIHHWRSPENANRPDLDLISCNNDCLADLPSETAITDTKEYVILKNVIDYLLDDSIKPDFLFHRYFAPSIVPA